MVNGWYYTPGWGALATTTVAVIAVVANIYTNKRTLRASAAQFEKSQQHAQTSLNTSIAQFEQVRQETRTDKLRVEIIGLINALAERKTRLDIAINRIDDALEKMNSAELRSPGSSDQARADRQMRAAMAEEYWEVYERASAHAFAVRLLTTEAELLRIVDEVQDAIATEREHYEFRVLAQNVHKRDEEYQREIVADTTLRYAAKALVTYCLSNLAPRASRTTDLDLNS